jgi:hypothetical protein
MLSQPVYFPCLLIITGPSLNITTVGKPQWHRKLLISLVLSGRIFKTFVCNITVKVNKIEGAVLCGI